METNTMIRELRNLQEKHRNDQTPTFGTRWADVCRDVADRLIELQNENILLKNQTMKCDKDNEPEQVIKLVGVGARAKLRVGDKECDVYLGGVDAYNTRERGKDRTIHKFSLIEI